MWTKPYYTWLSLSRASRCCSHKVPWKRYISKTEEPASTKLYLYWRAHFCHVISTEWGRRPAERHMCAQSSQEQRGFNSKQSNLSWSVTVHYRHPEAGHGSASPLSKTQFEQWGIWNRAGTYDWVTTLLSSVTYSRAVYHSR